MGFTEEQLSGEFHIPESAIENFEYMPVIDEKDIQILYKKVCKAQEKIDFCS
jgi:hypothetical protein